MVSFRKPVLILISLLAVSELSTYAEHTLLLSPHPMSYHPLWAEILLSLIKGLPVSIIVNALVVHRVSGQSSVTNRSEFWHLAVPWMDQEFPVLFSEVRGLLVKQLHVHPLGALSYQALHLGTDEGMQPEAEHEEQKKKGVCTQMCVPGQMDEKMMVSCNNDMQQHKASKYSICRKPVFVLCIALHSIDETTYVISILHTSTSTFNNLYIINRFIKSVKICSEPDWNTSQ